MKRAAEYIRMSTDDQTDSPERQHSQIVPYCQRQGYEIVKTYKDLGERGWDDSRPEFQRLLKDAKAGLFDVIVVDEGSRLSRQLPFDYIVKVAYPLREAGVAVDSVAEGLQDPSQLGGMILMAVRQDKASQESATLGRRTATGMARLAKDGKLFPGRAAYGYQYRMVDGERVGYIPGDPEHVRIVRHVFDAYLTRDLSLAAIAAELTSLHVPTPQGCDRWGKTTVHNILTNHVYAGCYVWGKVPQGRYYRCDGGEVVATKRGASKSARLPQEKWTILKDQHEPLVTPEVFDKVQEHLAANRIRTSPARKKATYPLSQLLLCSHCGTPMYGTKVQSGGREVTVYRCGSNMSNGQCAPRIVREGVIMGELADVLRQKFLEPSNLERLRAAIKEQQDLGTDQSKSVVDDLEKRAARLEKDIAEGKRKMPIIPEDLLPEYIAQIRSWQQELAETKTQLDRLSHESPADDLDQLVANAEKLVECLQSADPETVRALCRETIGRVDLRFDSVKKKVYTRYPLAGGVVHLLECAESSTSGPGGGR